MEEQHEAAIAAALRHGVLTLHLYNRRQEVRPPMSRGRCNATPRGGPVNFPVY